MAAPKQKIRFGNPNSNDTFDNSFSVDGQIEQIDKGERGDSVHGGTAEFRLAGGWDRFWFQGVLEDIQLGGGAQIEIGGRNYFRADAIGYDTREDGHEADNDGDKTGKAAPGGGETTIPVSPTVAEVKNPNPAKGEIARPMYSWGDIAIYVEKGREIESVREAFNRIPHNVLHEVRIFVLGETRDRGVAHIANVSMSNEPHFIIQGVDGAKLPGTNVNIDAKLDHIRHNNLEFTFLSQCVSGRYEDVTMGNNGLASFSGKTGGKMLVNCEVNGGRFGIQSIGNETVEVRGGVIHASEAAIDEHSASAHVLTGGVKIDAPAAYRGGSQRTWFGGREL